MSQKKSKQRNSQAYQHSNQRLHSKFKFIIFSMYSKLFSHIYVESKKEVKMGTEFI